MAAKTKRFWGFVTANAPASVVTAQAKMQEDAGLEGLLAVQLYSTPFAPWPLPPPPPAASAFSPASPSPSSAAPTRRPCTPWTWIT